MRRDLDREINPFVKISYRSNEADGSASMGNIGATESAGEGITNPSWTQSFWFIWKKGTHQVSALRAQICSTPSIGLYISLLRQVWTFRLFDHKNADRMIAEGELDVDQYVERQTSTVDLGEQYGKIIVEKTTPVKFKLSAK